MSDPQSPAPATAAAYRYLPAHLADRLTALSVSARRAMAGGMQGLHRSNRHGASVEFAEYRPYIAGDPPSLIDWRAFARTDRHLVKRYEEETNLTGFVCLDCSSSLDWSGGTPGAVASAGQRKFDYACTLAAAALYLLVSQGDRAGLLWFDAKVRGRMAPAGSPAALRPLLLALEGISPTDKGDIATALHAAAATLPRRSLVIVISDLLQDPAAVIGGLQHLHHDGHDVRVLHVVDRAEMTLPGTGLVEAVDRETGSRVEVEIDELRENYKIAVANHLNALRRGCQGLPADYRLATTDTLVEEALRWR